MGEKSSPTGAGLMGEERLRMGLRLLSEVEAFFLEGERVAVAEVETAEVAAA